MSRDKLWPEGHVEELYVELYVDALEGELDAEFEKDLAIWLKNSNSSRTVELEKLSQIRQGLKNSDDVVLPESGTYYDSLEARIMASLDSAIESGDVKDRTAPVESVGGSMSESISDSNGDVVLVALPLKTRKTAKGLVAQAAKLKGRSVSMRAGQLAILTGLALLTTGKWLIGPSIAKLSGESAVESSSAANQLRATRQAAPEVLTGTVISFESGADLALEIAARRMVAYHKGE